MKKPSTGILIACLTLAPAAWADLPEGPGREIVDRVCSACHGLSRFSDFRFDGETWKDKVGTMMGRGANATAEESKTIVAYLTRYLGTGGPEAAAPESAAPAIDAKASAAPRELPDGPGKPIILRECMGCHTPTALTTYQHTPQEWTAIVTRMGTRVKNVTQPELEVVGKYLADNYPKKEDNNRVNVNRAAPEEIAERLGLTPQEASALVEYRTKHGNFREWGDLLGIYGLNGKKVAAAKERMSF